MHLVSEIVPFPCTCAYKCTTCGETLKTETIKATGHTEVVLKARAATAKKLGLTEGKQCSVCKKVLVAQKMTLAQVTGLKASTVAKTSIKLAWTKVNGAKYYKVEQSTDGKKWTKVTTTTKLTYTLTKLTSGKKIYVKVTAVNAYAKESAASTVKNVTVKK